MISSPLLTLVVAPPEISPTVFSENYLKRIAQSTSLLAPTPVDPLTLEKQGDLLSKVEVIVGTWGMPVLSEDLLGKLPRLKAVFYAAGSVKCFLSDAFWKRSITLSCAAQANAIPVAEMTFAQIILSLKRFWYYGFQLRDSQKYNEERSCAGCYQTKVGLISLGAIGQRVLERLKTLEVEVWVYDPFLTPQAAKEAGVTAVSLEKLFSECDVVSLHAPWIPETEKMIQEKHLLSMKSGSTFINTSRGAIVDELGLVRALQQRPDLWAILDVTYPEPPEKNSPLYSLPNLVLTPHIAGSLNNECHRMADWMLEELKRFQNNEPLRHQVLEKHLATMA